METLRAARGEGKPRRGRLGRRRPRLGGGRRAIGRRRRIRGGGNGPSRQGRPGYRGRPGRRRLSACRGLSRGCRGRDPRRSDRWARRQLRLGRTRRRVRSRGARGRRACSRGCGRLGGLPGRLQPRPGGSRSGRRRPRGLALRLRGLSRRARRHSGGNGDTKVADQYAPLAKFLQDGLRTPLIIDGAGRGGAPTASPQNSLLNRPERGGPGPGGGQVLGRDEVPTPGVLGRRAGEGEDRETESTAPKPQSSQSTRPSRFSGLASLSTACPAQKTWNEWQATAVRRAV